MQPGRYIAASAGTRYRKLTPIEYERLQGLPDNYTAHVSNTQRYKMIGNGWQVDTIEYLFFWMVVSKLFL
jgi:site-specific DNA-cytosine methylase